MPRLYRDTRPAKRQKKVYKLCERLGINYRMVLLFVTRVYYVITMHGINKVINILLLMKSVALLLLLLLILLLLSAKVFSCFLNAGFPQAIMVVIMQVFCIFLI